MNYQQLLTDLRKERRFQGFGTNLSTWLELISFSPLKLEFKESLSAKVRKEWTRDMSQFSTGFEDKNFEFELSILLLSGFKEIKEDLVYEFSHYFNMRSLSLRKRLPDSLIRKHPDEVEWSSISTYRDLTEDLVYEFEDKIVWFILYNFGSFSLDFYRKNAYRLTKDNWEYVSISDYTSEEFIEAFADKINWSKVSTRFNLSYSFVMKHLDKLDLATILKFPDGLENMTEAEKNELTEMMELKKRFTSSIR